MTAAQEIIANLVAGGMDAVQAATLLAQAAVEMTSSGPSPGALRTRKWRHKTSQNVTCDANEPASPTVTERHKASQSVTSDKTPLTKEIDIKKRERQNRGSRITPDWTPSVAERTFARELGWSEPQIDREAENFRDYWVSCAGGKGLKLDWTATWRKWIRDSRTKPAGPTIIAQPSETDWRAILDSHRRFKHWPKGHGNEPGMPGCRAPPELLREFGFEPQAKTEPPPIPTMRTMQ